MISHPLQNTAIPFAGEFLQRRPVITQKFGERPEVYAQFGLLGHNGIDFRAPMGTQLFAPCEGTVRIHDEGTKGYGKYIEVFKKGFKVVLGHLSEFQVKDGEYVYLGQKIALSGNTGFSTAPHLHTTCKRLNDAGDTLDYSNGYKGAIDFKDLMITWKGTIGENNL